MYKSLQAGRAIAAIFVVLYHLGGSIALEKYFGIQEFSIPFLFGNAGVEFFFVLSGFIILTAHHQDLSQPAKIGTYFEKRIVRIYPTYWIIFLAVYLVAISSSLSDTVPHDIFSVFKSLLLLPQDKTLIGGTGAPVLIVAWTLQYEMLFYVFFAVMILNRMASVVVIFLWLYIYIMNHGDSTLNFPLSFLSKDYIILFLLGMIVSKVSTLKAFDVYKPLTYFYIGVVIFSFVSIDIVSGYNLFSDSRILLYGVASAIMIFGLVKSEDLGIVIGGSKWLQVLGASSYALYLIHFPLISILCKISIFVNLDKLGLIGALIAYLFIFIACLISAVAFHIWIEKPLNNYLRNSIAKIKASGFFRKKHA